MRRGLGCRTLSILDFPFRRNGPGHSILGTLEHAAMHLRTPLFVVMGHQGCGAVHAAMSRRAGEHMVTNLVRGVVVLLLGSISALTFAQSDAQRASAPASGQTRRIPLANVPFTGDFDRLLDRRVIRVLAPYSRSLYYLDKGQERGLTAELARDFEQYVNRKYAKQLGKRPLTVFLIVTTRDKLFSELAAGHGDIAAGNLTVTPEREKVADFFAPADRDNVRELLVTGPSSPAIAGLDDLAGKTIHVSKASSY
jgi:ABC-type amino acid transport substrate-binding protein